MLRHVLLRTLFLLVLPGMLASGAAMAGNPDPTGIDPTERILGHDVRVRPIAPGVWLHVTYRKSDREHQVSANGLLVTTGELSILIDTGWEPESTELLLDWAAETLGQPVEHLIVTHAHVDRAGGLEAVRSRPVIVHGHASTDQQLIRAGKPPIHWTFEFQDTLKLGGETVQLFYPGPGHTPDNVVVWLPRRKLLYTGCMVKSLEADDLGFVQDADLQRWPLAVRRVIEQYRDAVIVVPGHGSPGGVELLSHTMELLEAADGR